MNNFHWVVIPYNFFLASYIIARIDLCNRKEHEAGTKNRGGLLIKQYHMLYPYSVHIKY